MLFPSVFDSILRGALRVAHRFARALAEVLRCAGWDLAAAAAATYLGVSYSKAGHCRYALLSRVCLSMPVGDGGRLAGRLGRRRGQQGGAHGVSALDVRPSCLETVSALHLAAASALLLSLGGQRADAQQRQRHDRR